MVRDTLTQSWRQGSPTISRLRAREPGSNSVQIRRPESQKTRVRGQETMDVPAQTERKLALSLPFDSMLALEGLDDAPHPGEGDPRSVYWLKHSSLPETPKETPENLRLQQVPRRC